MTFIFLKIRKLEIYFQVFRAVYFDSIIVHFSLMSYTVIVAFLLDIRA